MPEIAENGYKKKIVIEANLMFSCVNLFTGGQVHARQTGRKEVKK